MKGLAAKELGIGIIGTGFMGKAHAFAYRAALAAFPDIPAPRLEMIQGRAPIWFRAVFCRLADAGK